LSIGLLFACNQNNVLSSNVGDDSYISDSKSIEEDLNQSMVVCYSATNNTQRVANIIASYISASTFPLEPVNLYTREDLNYNDSSRRGSKEHNDSNRHVESMPNTIENFQNYKYVFIGYPIWWGEASWVIDDFVIKNDFTDKTIILFATAASSPLISSTKKMEEKLKQ